jgi:hypothetical protein
MKLNNHMYSIDLSFVSIDTKFRAIATNPLLDLGKAHTFLRWNRNNALNKS